MATPKKKNGGLSKYRQLLNEIETLRIEQADLSKRADTLVRRNLRLAELNQAKDEFIAVASHQLRTPATGVKQYIGLLLEGYSDALSENQKFFLKRAYESNDRQLHIIDDLLRVARIDSSTFKLAKDEIDIRELVVNVINELRKKAENRNQKIIYSASQRTMLARVDAPRLRMVVENLVDNGLKYSLDNTPVKVSLAKSKAEICITVADEGVGISPEDFHKLFQKFSRIANPLSVEIGGSGLGLYWADKIVKLHGGVIEVSSGLGKGSVFKVIIPIIE